MPIGSSLAEAERWLIEATLAHWAGNKNRAAKTLGCSLKTLYNKLAIYERQGEQQGEGMETHRIEQRFALREMGKPMAKVLLSG